MVKQGSSCSFAFWLFVSQVLVAGATVLIAAWTVLYQGGLNWAGAQLVNNHSFFMVLGLIFVYTEALLVYRVFPNCKKTCTKLLHAFLHLLALSFVFVGLTAMYTLKSAAASPTHLRSLHSWVGITTVVLYILQWLCGFITFLFPGLRKSQRAAYHPFHVFWGLTIYAGAIMAVLLGVHTRTSGTEFTATRVIGLSLGVVVAATGIVVASIVTRPEFARQPEPEEEHIPLNG